MGPSITMATLFATVSMHNIISIAATASSAERWVSVYLDSLLIRASKNPPLSNRLTNPIRNIAKIAISTRLMIPSTNTPWTEKVSISTTSKRESGNSPETSPNTIPTLPADIIATMRFTPLYIRNIRSAGTIIIRRPLGESSPTNDKSGSTFFPVPPIKRNITVAKPADANAYFNLERTT